MLIIYIFPIGILSRGTMGPKSQDKGEENSNMRILKMIDRWITILEEKILIFSVLVMAFILIGNVISRMVFNFSWAFAEESGQFLVIAITFIGISYGARKGRHISMTILMDLSPHKVKKILILIISSITSLTLFYLAYLGIKYTIKVESLGSVTPSLRVPMYFIVMMVPIGFILGGIQYARNFWINIKEKELYIGTEKPGFPDEEFGAAKADQESDYKMSNIV